MSLKKAFSLLGNLNRARSASNQRFAVSLLNIAFAAIIMFAMASCKAPDEPPESGERTVSIFGITGIEKPRTGRTPVTSFDNNEQYSGTVTWLPEVNGTFAFNVEYTATITLKAKSGYTFKGVRANLFSVYDSSYVSVGNCSNAANSGDVTVRFSATQFEQVTMTAIQGLDVPVLGNIPVTAITETPQYSGTVTWSPDLDVDGTFANAIPYTATVAITFKPGLFTDSRPDFFTVAGATDVVYTRGTSGNSDIITVRFPPTGGTIRLATIQGLRVPVTGEIPVTNIYPDYPNTQYSGTVTWSPAVDGTFADSTVYTATVTITPETGYTLYGIGADFFRVAGATTVSNAANSGVVTVTFPRTIGPINIAAIQGLSVPVTGEIPVTVITENEQYSGTVSWYPPYMYYSGIFADSTVYTATVTITPKTGYTLDGIAADFFTVAGAAEVVYTRNIYSNSGYVTVTFPPTAAIVPANRFEYYWVDEHGSLVTTSGGAVFVAVDEILTFTATGTGYDAIQWHRNGSNTGQSGNTYDFSSTTTGKYTIGLFVEKDGKPYNTNITITVAPKVIVTFYINGGTGTAPAQRTVASGASIILPDGNGFSAAGYTFSGWNTRADGTGTYFKAGSSYTPTDNISFYAIWSNGTMAYPYPLIAGVWSTGSITSASSVWYSFNVTSGTTYRIWWNDLDGMGNRTFDVKVSAYYFSGATIGATIFSGVDWGWGGSRPPPSQTGFTASQTGVVKVQVSPYKSGETGTFDIIYSIGTVRP